jgi:hypothetical protein
VQDRQELLDEEKRRAHVDGEQSVEILDRRFLYRCRFRHAGVSDKDIEAVADDLARPLCQLVWPVGRREVDADRVRAAAALANLRDDPLGFLGAAAEVYQNLGARLSELERARAPQPARGAGDESRFS